MDLMYIANPSFMEDLRICFATVKILFMPESTEGVAEFMDIKFLSVLCEALLFIKYRTSILPFDGDGR